MHKCTNFFPGLSLYKSPPTIYNGQIHRHRCHDLRLDLKLQSTSSAAHSDMGTDAPANKFHASSPSSSSKNHLQLLHLCVRASDCWPADSLYISLYINPLGESEQGQNSGTLQAAGRQSRENREDGDGHGSGCDLLQLPGHGRGIRGGGVLVRAVLEGAARAGARAAAARRAPPPAGQARPGRLRCAGQEARPCLQVIPIPCRRSAFQKFRVLILWDVEL